MKNVIALLLTAGLVLAGCSKVEEAKPGATPAGQPQTMPSLSQDKTSMPPTESAPPPVPGTVPVAAAPAPSAEANPGGAKRLTDQEITMLNYAVYKYKEQFGRFPKSLQEMVGTPHLTRVPVPPPDQKIDYDPANGIVKVINP